MRRHSRRIFLGIIICVPTPALQYLSWALCLVAVFVFLVVSILLSLLSSSASHCRHHGIFPNVDGIVVVVGFPSCVCLRRLCCSRSLVVVLAVGISSLLSTAASCRHRRRRCLHRRRGVLCLTLYYLRLNLLQSLLGLVDFPSPKWAG